MQNVWDLSNNASQPGQREKMIMIGGRNSTVVFSDDDGKLKSGDHASIETMDLGAIASRLVTLG